MMLICMIICLVDNKQATFTRSNLCFDLLHFLLMICVVSRMPAIIIRTAALLGLLGRITVSVTKIFNLLF